RTYTLGPVTRSARDPAPVPVPAQLSLPTDDASGRLVHSVEVRRSARRQRTVAARLEGGNLIVFLPARMSRAEEAEWVERMRQRLERRERRRDQHSAGEVDRRPQGPDQR